jgi:hypothetical protein
MAKKEIVEPATRSNAFLSGQRPLLLSDLTPEERTSAFEAVSAHTNKTRENLAKFAAKIDHPNKEVAGNDIRKTFIELSVPEDVKIIFCDTEMQSLLTCYFFFGTQLGTFLPFFIFIPIIS